MSTNKKSPAGAGTLAGGQKQMAGGPLTSHCQLTTESDRPQGKIAPLLGRGEENAIPTERLLGMTGLRSSRELRKQIRLERVSGLLILSSVRGRGGYFLPADGEQGRQEIQQYTSTLRARALNTLAVLRAARQALRELDGQVAIKDGLGE